MRLTYFAFIAIILSFNVVRAQESMLQDISYPYLERLIAYAKANYPRSKSYDVRISEARTTVNKAKISYADALTLSYNYTPFPTTTVTTVGPLGGYQLGFFLNVGSLLQKPFTVKQAKDDLKIAKYEKQANDLNIESQIKQRYFAYIQRTAILKMKSQSLIDAETVLKNTKYKFEKGEETLNNYDMALIMYTGHGEEKITAETEYLVAKANLEELLGAKLEDIK
ncbi:MAG: TolC family protein [Taibaiella sp.]|nr:TolC family protein [Taibaiella sp.]